MTTDDPARVQYRVVDYRPGDGASVEAPMTDDRVIAALRGHLEHLFAGHRAALVVMAGPWTGEMLSGFCIVHGRGDTIDEFVATDPAVRQQVLVPSLREWSPLVGIPSTDSRD